MLTYYLARLQQQTDFAESIAGTLRGVIKARTLRGVIKAGTIRGVIKARTLRGVIKALFVYI
jgi:hypothetical protein